MADYELLVIGGGTGNNVAAAAADAGLETALVEPGKLGGTCLNRGCNPSKMLIQAANAANDIRDAAKFHVDATLNGVDHATVTAEMDDLLSGIAEGMAERYRGKDNLTLYDEYTEFVDERTVRLGGEASGASRSSSEGTSDGGADVTAERVVVATGSRPIVPPIDGLDDTDHLTSQEALYLDEAPDSLVILGGGYIAVELGYALDALGTDVTIVEMMNSLIPREDGDVAETFTGIAAERHDVYTGHRVTAVEGGPTKTVHAVTEAGDEIAVEGDEVLVALGRRPNSDRLNLEAAGIETGDNGFIVTDDHLGTSAENVWAQGDVADNAMFKHSGDYETDHVVANAVHGEARALDLSAMPHVIFTEPQIGGVGATEEELEEAGTEYVVGRAAYADSAMGRAKKLEDGFAKVLAAPDGELLGCHVIGYEASTLLHEAVVAMRNGVTVPELADTIHAHPTLNKVMLSAFRDVPVEA